MENVMKKPFSVVMRESNDRVLEDEVRFIQYEEFIEVVKTQVDNALDEYSVQINHVTKNNGKELDGLVICSDKTVVSPVIYLESFYYAYLNGISIVEITERIINAFCNASGEEYENLNIGYEYTEVKKSIILKLVNFDKNEQLLKSIPYVRFLDMAIVFSYLVKSDVDGIASIRITNEHTKVWEIDENILLRDAVVNTEREFPSTLRSMLEVLKEIAYSNPGMIFGDGSISMLENYSEYNLDEVENDEEYTDNSSDNMIYDNCSKTEISNKIIDNMLDTIVADKNCEMYVLSNNRGINGASSILYKGIMKKISERLKSDFLVLPSSIHEVILIPWKDDIYSDVDQLRDMVYEINISQVPEEDVLSDNIYRYIREDNKITLINN